VLKHTLENTRLITDNHWEKNEIPDGWVALPPAFDDAILKYPEVKPLLVFLAERDPATFMHSFAVHATAMELLKDWRPLLNLPIKTTLEIQKKLIFCLLHDIGKTLAAVYKQNSQSIIYPNHSTQRGCCDRKTEDVAKHWIHPEMGYSLLIDWSNQVSDAQQRTIQNWAKLTRAHDRQLLSYFSEDPLKNLTHLDHIALELFRIADVTMAMGLPRPNREREWDETTISQVIRSKHQSSLKNDLLIEYSTQSVLSSLQYLKKTYQRNDFTNPQGLFSKKFQVSTAPETKNEISNQEQVARIWDIFESDWDWLILNMYHAGVFNFTPKKSP
jgi:hypothetical protein